MLSLKLLEKTFAAAIQEFSAVTAFAPKLVTKLLVNVGVITSAADAHFGTPVATAANKPSASRTLARTDSARRFVKFISNSFARARGLCGVRKRGGRRRDRTYRSGHMVARCGRNSHGLRIASRLR